MESQSIRAVWAGDAWRVVVTWRNGGESAVDLQGHLERFAIFDPLRTNAVAFRDVAIGEHGWSIGWNDDMEVSSDTLWRLALEQGAAWLKAWRTERGLTEDAAATRLGLSKRMVQSYEAGRHLLPKTVRLACAGADLEYAA